ncbi:hypothetical protein A2U01_0071612, partial [Trifolium medium]|nr:hypothetical protein [Trifolium medium]
RQLAKLQAVALSLSPERIQPEILHIDISCKTFAGISNGSITSAATKIPCNSPFSFRNSNF